MSHEPIVRLSDLSGEVIDPDLIALHDQMRRIQDDFAKSVAISREKFYWKMIANGWLPSMGWRVAERIEHKDGKMTYHIWAKPPKPKTRSQS